MVADSDFEKQLQGYVLATAHIVYRMPDHPGLLQSYIWQAYDLAPKFPELHKFLAFWTRELDGPLHSVEVAGRRLIGPGDMRSIETEYALN
ncbi:MAG: usg protein [Pseudomonadota bacterium]